MGVALRSPHTPCPASPQLFGAAAWLLAPPAGRKQGGQFVFGPGRLDNWMMVIFFMACVSQKVLIVQKFGVLASLPEAVEAEVEVELDHLFAWREKHSVSRLSDGNHTGKPSLLLTACLALVPLALELLQTERSP